MPQINKKGCVVERTGNGITRVGWEVGGTAAELQESDTQSLGGRLGYTRRKSPVPTIRAEFPCYACRCAVGCSSSGVGSVQRGLRTSCCEEEDVRKVEVGFAFRRPKGP